MAESDPNGPCDPPSWPPEPITCDIVMGMARAIYDRALKLSCDPANPDPASSLDAAVKAAALMAWLLWLEARVRP